MHYNQVYPKILLFLVWGTYSVSSSNKFSTKICERGQLNQQSNKLSYETNECTSKINPIPKCAKPVDELYQGYNSPGLIDLPSYAPPWLNKTRYTIGQKFAQKNYFVMSFCHYVGAILVAFGANAGKIIIGTGKSHLLEKSIPRYAATMRHIWLWYERELVDEDDIVFTSLTNVRAIHKSVDVQYGNSSVDKRTAWVKETLQWELDEKMWNAMQMDLVNSSIPQEYRQADENVRQFTENSKITMNQMYMSITQHLFVSIPLIVEPIFNMLSPTEEDMLGWNHLWAVLGYAMGIEDEYNIALHPTLKETRAYYSQFLNKILMPGLFHPDWESKVLVEILLKTALESGIKFDFLTSRLLMTIILKDILGIETPHMKSLLSNTENIALHIQPVINGLMKYSPQFIVDSVNSWVKGHVDNIGEAWFKHAYKSDYLIAKYMYY